MHSSMMLAAGPARFMPALHATTVSCRHVAVYHAEADRRWPMIVRKLASLRNRGRRSLRVVDVNCGAGDLLLAVARQARALGFVAIEGRGVDPDAVKVIDAIAAAARLRDPAIGLVFELGDGRAALREEADFPADLVLYAAQERNQAAVRDMARSAGRTALGAQA